jgi:phosphate transport system protein
MPGSTEGFVARVDRLTADVTEQGRRVLNVIEGAFDALFSADAGAAGRVVRMDDAIDRVDVEIEKASVRLLADATTEACNLGDQTLRSVLTVVKVNNELERVADAAVLIASSVAEGRIGDGKLPDTMRVLCNSVIGILRDVVRALDRSDAELARIVLHSEDAVEQFKSALLRDAEQQIADAEMTVDLAFTLHEIASQCERMADHCTNIAEQIIYAATGKIVRHTDAGWVDVPNQRPAGA